MSTVDVAVVVVHGIIMALVAAVVGAVVAAVGIAVVVVVVVDFGSLLESRLTPSR